MLVMYQGAAQNPAKTALGESKNLKTQPAAQVTC